MSSSSANNRCKGPPVWWLLVAIGFIAAIHQVTPAYSSPQTTTSAPTTTSATNQTKLQLSPDEAKKEVLSKMAPIHGGSDPSSQRLAFNKPTTLQSEADFAPESIEARVSEATTRFGLNFIASATKESSNQNENVIISPISLQNLLNIILLGAGKSSHTERELARVLGYDKTNLLASDDGADRLQVHQAMKNVISDIIAATHLSVPPKSLLQTDPEVVQPNKSQLVVTAHLQTTSTQEGQEPLSGQLNFTLANLVLANKDKVTLKLDYERDLASYYNVKIEAFSRNGTGPAAAPSSANGSLHDRVNRWVEQETKGQISKIADESDLSSEDLIIVLLNAATFKSRWLHTFNPKATHEKTFFNGGQVNQGRPAEFMRQKGTFGYAEFGSAVQYDTNPMLDIHLSDDSETLLTDDASSPAPAPAPASDQNSTQPEVSKEESKRLELTSKLNCSALMLPFSLNDGKELSMVILLPAKVDGLPELMSALDEQSLGEVYRSLTEQQVQVEIPKFSFEAKYSARPILEQMGLKSMFNETANFERMIGKTSAGAKVDKVVHKAKISVDESGAEAAAATMANVVMRNFIRPPLAMFIADRPFLFVIRHNKSNMPLFMGYVNSIST